MPRTVTIELTDEQAEVLDALTAGTGIGPDIVLVRAIGQGLAAMIHEVEYAGPDYEREEPGGHDNALLMSRVKWAHQPDLDDDIPF